jgi:hypothetical protein
MRAARTASILSVTALLAFGAAGCGGSKADYQEVPGGPVDVSIPTDPNLDTSGSASGSATPTPTPTATAAPGSTTAPSDESGSTGTTPASGTDTTSSGTGTGGTSTDTSGGATPGSDSGGASAPGSDDTANSDSPPPAGSDAQQFEDFCAQNPGAC